MAKRLVWETLRKLWDPFDWPLAIAIVGLGLSTLFHVLTTGASDDKHLVATINDVRSDLVESARLFNKWQAEFDDRYGDVQSIPDEETAKAKESKEWKGVQYERTNMLHRVESHLADLEFVNHEAHCSHKTFLVNTLGALLSETCRKELSRLLDRDGRPKAAALARGLDAECLDFNEFSRNLGVSLPPRYARGVAARSTVYPPSHALGRGVDHTPRGASVLMCRGRRSCSAVPLRACRGWLSDGASFCKRRLTG